MTNKTYCEIKENTLVIDLHQLHPIHTLNNGHRTVICELSIQVFEEVAKKLSGSEWNRDELEDSIDDWIREYIESDDDMCKDIIEEYGPRKAMDEYLETLDREDNEFSIYDVMSIPYQLANNIMKLTMMKTDQKAWKQVIDAVHQYEEEHDSQPTFVFKW
jgi:hemerythrin